MELSLSCLQWLLVLVFHGFMSVLCHLLSKVCNPSLPGYSPKTFDITLPDKP